MFCSMHNIMLLLVSLLLLGRISAKQLELRKDKADIEDSFLRLRRLATLKYVGEDFGSEFLDRCEGDCDSDDDCKGDLKCFERFDDEPVPGCRGDESREPGKDFCYDPNDDDDDDEDDGNKRSSSRGFRLRIYWEKGFFWQEESHETFWCLDCDGSTCSENDYLHIEDCEDDDSGSTRFEFIGSSSEAQIKVVDEDLCLELVSNREIVLQECDSNNSKQKFQPGPGSKGSFSDRKFEIVPKTKQSGCLNQSHHPRDGEYVFIEDDCDVARMDDTNYYEKF